MNFLAFLSTLATLVLASTSVVESWSLRFLPTTITGGCNVGKEMFAASLFGASLLVSPLSAPATVDVSGSYSDPNHPNCQRIIEVKKGSPTEFTLTGTDGNPGCSVDGSGLKTFQLVGKVDSESNVYVDFSPKGGPKDLKGLYDSNKRAIQWPDGNVWTMKN
jgi:hypothetical protein